MQSIEVCHNIGFDIMLYFELLSFQYQGNFFVTLENVIAINNTNNSEVIICMTSRSVVYANGIDNLMLSNVSIINNRMSGIILHTTKLLLNGTLVLLNNTGIDGGGLALYQRSYLVLYKNSVLNFTNNTAKQRGGAIFVDIQFDTNIGTCFYQYSDHTYPESVKAVTMTGNKADIAGTAIYGGDIADCFLFFTNYFSASSVIYNRTFDYSAQTGPSVISSESTNICFCDDNKTINCSQIQLTMTAYPGEEIYISVVTVGQLDGVSPGILQIRPLDNTGDIGLYNTSAKECTTIALKPITSHTD